MKHEHEVLDKRNLWFVITASSVGTLIEWYDFYIFGSLATILSEQFFPKTKSAHCVWHDKFALAP